MAEILPRFMHAYPKVQVIERVTSGIVDLIEEGLDRALRAHAKPLESSSLVQRAVCRIQLILIASPSFLERVGRPQDPQNLQEATSLARHANVEEAA